MSSNSLVDFTLHLADSSLILSQRNAEWCGHGPVLEQDIAITNISLDLLGQARNFYQYAALLIGGDATEDRLAYLRNEREFKNPLLCELPKGDWGHTVLRQYLFSQYQYLLFEQLSGGNDEQLAAIATKALKEIKYHLRWSSEWVIRLGDGTEESHQRMLAATEQLWQYTGELFTPASYEAVVPIDCSAIYDEWTNEISLVFAEARLPVPSGVFMQQGGKVGMHTEHMGFLLAELQYLQRSYPACEW